jgi:hypothetical protein
VNKSWTIRNAGVADAAAIEDFLVSVPEFRGMLQPVEQREVWQWLYSRSGEPIEDVLIAESQKGTVIAHYGLSRLPYVLAGEKVDAGMACLLAIDESYRSTSVFLEVTIRLLKLFRGRGWAFVTGLANRTGLLEFHKAFGFKDIGEVPIFAKPFRLREIAKAVFPKATYFFLSPGIWFAQWAWLLLLRQSARPGRTEVRLEPISSFDDALAAATDAIAKHHKFYADRGDASLLNARFFGIACRNYHVLKIVRDGVSLGYVALRVMEMKGFLALGIVDICFDFSRRDIADAVFAAIDCFALERRVDLVSILTSSLPLIARLKRHWYLKAPESFRLVVFEPAKIFDLAESRIDDWFVTWFEHDYI